MATARCIFPLVILVLTCISAWGQANRNPQATNTPQTVFEAPKVPAGGADTTAQPIDPRTYLVGAEDILRVEVFRDDTLTRSVSVRPDGKITMPLVGDLQAEGLTPERLGVQLKEALSQFINSPEVTVTVLQVNSKTFSISGMVNRPGRYPLVTPIRIFDALGLAGSFRDFANTKDIVIVRGPTLRLHFNYNDYMKGKKQAIDQNVLLENGDTIIVK